MLDARYAIQNSGRKLAFETVQQVTQDSYNCVILFQSLTFIESNTKLA